MNEIYNEDYYTKAKNSPYIGYPKSNLGVDVYSVMMFRADEICVAFPSNISIIDWGCATGILVSILRNKGFNAIGYDFAEWAIENKLSEFVYRADALKIKEEEIPIVDVMYSSDFIEHLPPQEVLPFLIKISKRCKKEMWHYVPFYPELNTPTAGPGNVHLTQVNAKWWREIFEKIPDFKIIFFPADVFGGMVKCERKGELK